MKKQELLWVGEWKLGGFNGRIPRAAPVLYPYIEKPNRVWTLLTSTEFSKDVPPRLPFKPIHLVNAFLEDYIHDWKILDRGVHTEFHYYSRVQDGPVWLLLEF